MKRLSLILIVFIVSMKAFSQKFEDHKVYLMNSGITSSIVKVLPVSDYSIKKDSRITWVNYEKGKEHIIITASENRTKIKRFCNLVLLDKEGTPVDTLQIIQGASSLRNSSNTGKATSNVSTISRTKSSYTKKNSNNTSTKSYGGRCAAITKKGTRCSRTASAGSRYCWQHK